MSLALEQALEAESAGEVPVGAVVVKDGAVIGRGRNRTIEWRDPSAHAEVLALKEAANFCGTHRMSGLQLYVTLEPCAMCCGAIFHSRIERVVYGAADPKTGCAGSVLNLFSMKRLNHHAQVCGGVLADRCSSVLKLFFERGRATQRALFVPVREDALRTPDAAFRGLLTENIPSSFYVGGDGLRMHYRDLRPVTASKSVLCIHELPYWSEQLASLISKFGHLGCRTISPDLIGCGLSDKPKKAAWHTEAAHAHTLSALLSHLNVIPNIVLALGTTVNIALALIQNPLWAGVKLIHVDRRRDGDSALEVSATPSSTEKAGPWKTRHQRYLSGLSPHAHRVVLAPFPDAGHAAILSGVQHDERVRKEHPVFAHLVRPTSSNLYDIEPEIERALLRLLEQG